jgi:hypothetical protein
MSSPLPCYPNLFRYGSKIGGAYKSAGSISITPTSSITSNGSTNGIIGSIRWTDTNYALVLQSFAIQLLSLTGYTTAAPAGISAFKVTGYTAADTGGTDVLSSFMTSSITGMPTSRISSVSVCVAATAAMTAGTRTIGNPVYAVGSWATTSPGIIQAGYQYQLSWDNDEPLVLLANEGIEYQIPYGYTVPAAKNFTANIFSSWIEVPRELIYERYGL